MLTRIGVNQASHRFPHFLPDGRHFLYYVPNNADVRGVYLGRLGDNGAAVRLIDAEAAAVFAAPAGSLLLYGVLVAIDRKVVWWR